MTSLLDAPTGGAPLLGDQRPRIWTAPPSLSSAGEDAVGLARTAGLELDPWQQWVLDKALGERADGRWSAFEVGVVVGRQNGKGVLLEARELAGLFLFGERLILHTAHQFKTSSEAFLRLRTLIDNNDALRKRVRRVLTGKGDEAVELRSGQRLRFIARSKVSGRGFSGDCVILDEAFELPETSMAALLPTMSARPNPQLWYTSSAVNQAEHKQGDVLARVRRRALRGDPRLAYSEWSAGDRELLSDADLASLRDSPAAYARANPGLGIRISQEFVERERASLAARSLEVERLGIGDWPSEDEARWLVIPKAAWQARCDPVRPEQPFALSVACAWPDAEWTAIGLAGRGADGRMCVDLADYRRGTSWVVERVAELLGGYTTCAVVLDAGGPAGSLVADFEAAGVELVKPAMREAAQAYGQFHAAVCGDSPSLAHPGHADLDAAVAAAQRRPLADGWVWARKTSTDICPLEAVTLAAWGCASFGHLGVELAPDDVGVYVI